MSSKAVYAAKIFTTGCSQAVEAFDADFKLKRVFEWPQSDPKPMHR
jgi:hypothetical protein